MDGLIIIEKELTTIKGIWRGVVGLLGTLLACLALMVLSVLLLQAGMNEYVVVATIFICLVLFLRPSWAEFCEESADSFFGCFYGTLSALAVIPKDSFIALSRAIAVPLSPPKSHLA